MYISIVTGVIHSYKIENDNMIVITKVSNMRFWPLYTSKCS